MSIDMTLRVHLNAVIQLIHEHTNTPIVQHLPKIYTSCPVDIVRKSAGRFAFVNATEPQFSIRIELPLFLPEKLLLDAKFEGVVQTVRMTPVPDSVLGAPKSGQTYLCGRGVPDEKVFLHCDVCFCRIRFLRLLEDGRALFESRNFQDAGTGRTLLLTDGAGKRKMITTMIEPEYMPNRYFLSEQPVTDLDTESGLTAEPVITARADNCGKFLAAAEELREGNCTVLENDGSVRKEYPFKPGGRFIME